MKIKITEINGWSKLIEIKKSLTRIGSASYADIQLPSNSVAPLHLQLISNPELPTGCRAVNFAHQLEIRNGGIGNPFPTNSTFDLQNGDEIQLGDYKLEFILSQTATLLRSSASMEASIKFSDTLLQPDLSLDGVLTIKNLGRKDACHFRVQVGGFPEDCYRIDPIPLFYPGASEEILVHLYHRTIYPIAGLHELLLTIDAPEAYPGEEVVIRQGIYVSPVFKQSIEILDALSDLNPVQIKTGSPQPDKKAHDFQTPQTTQMPPESKLPLLIDQVKKEEPPKLPVTRRIKKNPVEKSPEPATLKNTTSEVSIPVQVAPVIEIQAQPAESVQVEPQVENRVEEVAAEKTESPVIQKLDISKVKVAGKQSDQFWEES